MAPHLAYFESAARPAESLAGRMLRVATLVANLWSVLAAGLLFLALDKTSHLHERIRTFAIAALILALGMFSLILPFHYVIKAHQKRRSE